MNLRALLVALFDLMVVAVVWVVAFWLSYNLTVFDLASPVILFSLPWVLIVYAITFRYFGLYRGMWRFASLPDLKRILVAVGVAACVVPLLLFVTQQLNEVPRAVLVFHPILLIMVMGGTRFSYRLWKDGYFLTIGESGSEPVLVLGAGSVGVSLVRSLHAKKQWRVVGFLDDDATKIGRYLHEVPVLGVLADVEVCAQRLGVKNVVIAIPKATASVRRQAAELATSAGLTVMTVPAVDDLLSGKVSVSQIRPVELEDLLGRDRIELDEAGLHGLLNNKTILVTGAGGSIGAELCRQIARFGPRKIVLFDHSEIALFNIEQELSRREVLCVVRSILGDVKDRARVDEVFSEYHPNVVFHAAAYKHVPLTEAGNAWEAIKNNVQGTLNLARAAAASGTYEFVLISTDKAVNPTNVMGASKRLAEMVCQAVQGASSAESQNRLSGVAPTHTRFVTVRFGNVLGSSGSVIPVFRQQLASGGPITVTHPDVMRYFMLIPEAAQLVLQAGLMATKSDLVGTIFVLDMGEPIKIIDLARGMIRLSGYSEDDIRITYIGLRPGEKLHEELLADGELTLPTPHPKLRLAKPTFVPDIAWLAELEEWLSEPCRAEAAVKDGLKSRVPEYQLPEN